MSSFTSEEDLPAVRHWPFDDVDRWLRMPPWLEALEACDAELHATTVPTRKRVWQEDLYSKLRNSANWSALAIRWVQFCTHTNLSQKQAIWHFIEYIEQYFVHRNAQERTIQEDACSEILLRAQIAGIEESIELPAKHSLLVIEEDNEEFVDECYVREGEAAPVSPPSISRAPSAKSAEKVFKDPSDRLHGGNLPHFTQENRAQWLAQVKQQGKSVLNNWNMALKLYFMEGSENNEAELGAVQALQEMRAITESTYKSAGWLAQLQASQLPYTLLDLSRPGYELQHACPGLMDSFKLRDWQLALGEILSRWTPLDEGIEEAAENHRQHLRSMMERASRKMTPETFFRYFNQYPSLVPPPSDPTRAFFLSGWDNFQDYWFNVFRPKMQRENINVDDFQVRQLWDWIGRRTPEQIMKLGISDSRLLQMALDAHRLRELRRVDRRHLFRVPSATIPHEQRLDPLPLAIKDWIEDDPTANSCKRCADLDATRKCVLNVILPFDSEDDENCQAWKAKLQGTVLTCAAPHDRIPPKPPTKRDGQAARQEFQYYSPHDLGMREIGPRKEVSDLCGRDVYKLFTRDRVMIGGCAFEAFKGAPGLLQQLQDNHRIASQYSRIVRNGLFRRFSYGKMMGMGSRQPMGGLAGDNYRAYGDMKSSSVQKIQDIFKHGVDAEAMYTVSEAHCPELAKDDSRALNDSGLNFLGSSRANLYYCYNYMAPQHCDDDVGWARCVQLQKQCRDDEYNFAYSQFGVYIQTEPGTVWWFKSSHLHGTIMPRRSTFQGTAGPGSISLTHRAHRAARTSAAPASLQSGNPDVGSGPEPGDAGAITANAVAPGTSNGVHVTRRRRDTVRSAHLRNVRDSHEARHRYWTRSSAGGTQPGR